MRRVSIVVPVYNGAATILELLDALYAQSYPLDLIEVIIVDNCSNDETISLIESKSPFNLTILTEPIPSSYSARNLGIAHASGDIIAFTDADCTVPPKWISSAVEYFENDPQLSVLWGSVQVKIPPSAPPEGHHIFEQILSFSLKHSSKMGAGYTANLFVKRNTFSIVGLFEPLLTSSGDDYWGLKVNASGLRVKLTSDVYVFHPPRDRSQILEKSRRVAGGLTYLVKESNFSRDALLKWMRFSFTPPILASVQILSSKHFPLWPKVTAVGILWQQKLNAAIESAKVLSGKVPIHH